MISRILEQIFLVVQLSQEQVNALCTSLLNKLANSIILIA